MRRIFHATTAIVASLSLLAPDLVAAQQAGDSADQGAGAEVAPRKHRSAQDSDQAPRGKAEQEVTEAPAPEAPAEQVPDTAETPQAAPEEEPAPRKHEQAAPDEGATAKPEANAEAAPPAAADEMGTPDSPVTQESEAPAEKPRAVREVTPERPAPVQREVGDNAPEPAPREGRRGDAPPKPAPQNSEAGADASGQAARGNADDAPRRKPQDPQGEAAGNDAEPRETQPSRARERAGAPKDPVAEPQAERGRDDAPVGEDPDALRRALDQQADPDARPPVAPDAADAGRPSAQADKGQPRPGRNGAAETAGGAGQNGADQADAAPNRPRRAPDDAPEAGAVETDAARAAANPKPAAPSAALRAATGDKDENDAGNPRGEVTDFTVTADDARRSDEDFDTSVARSLNADQIRELTEAPDEKPDEARAKDDDDNRGRDLARLALAGLAGYAVGSWMSNDRQVALNTGDRVVVTLPDGSQQLIKNDDTLLFRPGSNVQTERYEDGSSITTVIREDGSRVVTIRDANMNILRRSVVWPDGRSTMLIDDTADIEPVRVSDLPPPARPVDYTDQMSEEALREALMRESNIDRRFTLGQIRDIAQVRALVAPLDIQSITFDTGSAAITPNQAEQLSALGRVIAESVRQNPGELYLIEGYTDAVGSDASNLALSDRRAESVALALTEYFDVPPENMVVQGYGEQFLRIQTPDAERANRRVAVRRITDLIEQN